jgi:uncharacterized protein YbaR (Trm112 family)
MIDQPNNNPPPAAPVLEFQCPVCQQQGRPYTIRKAQPVAEITYTSTASIIVFSHEQGLTCPRCNSYFRIGLAGCQFGQMQWGLSQAERPVGLILAPKGAIQ